MLPSNKSIGGEIPVIRKEVSGLIYDISKRIEEIEKNLSILTGKLDSVLSPDISAIGGEPSKTAKTVAGQNLQSILDSLDSLNIRIDLLSQRTEV